MSIDKKIKIAVNIVMIILLPLLMAYSIVGERAHEWLGITMGVLFITHHILNWRWHTQILKGSYSYRRILGLFVNVVIFLILIAMLVSGIIMSHYVFNFSHISSGTAVARIVHLLGAYWGFIFMSLHIGLHGSMITSSIHRTLGSRIATVTAQVLRVLIYVIAAYGAYVFYDEKILSYLTLDNQFVFFDFDSSVPLFMAKYICMMVLFAVLGWHVT